MEIINLPFHDKNAINEFHSVWAAVYERSKGRLVPESIDDLTWAFSAKNHWFHQGKGILLWERNKTRAAAFFNPNASYFNAPVAYFGFWETLPGQQAVNDEIFEKINAWAKAQGAKHVVGPINFNTFFSYRLRLDSFEEQTFFNEPNQPEYYRPIIESMNFKLVVNYISPRCEDVEKIKAFHGSNRKLIADLAANNLKVSSLTAHIFLERLPEIYDFLSATFQDNTLYTPISWDTFKEDLAEPASAKLCPLTSVICTDLDSSIAGFFLCYPDYQPLTVAGKRTSEICFEKHFKLLGQPRCIANTGGVLPKYRNLGLFNAMVAELAGRVAENYSSLVSGLIREGNPSQNPALRLGDRDVKYGLFARKAE